MQELSKKEILERAPKWINNWYQCEKCHGMNWLPMEVGTQSAPRLTLFFIHMQCLDCGHYQDTDSIRLEEFLKLTGKE